MRKFFFLVLVLQSLLGSSQKDLLVPFRVGDLFGLSDLDGKIKLKAQFDLIQPIGSGYFTYTIKQKAADTIYNRQSFEIREKTISTQGLLLGTKVIIKNSNHNHFTFVPEGLIIGSQESYVSKNSNFYTLKGEKLLTENVSKFRFLGNPSSVSSHSRFITIFAEHFDKTMSLLVFDAEKQLMEEPILNHVTDFSLDRDLSSEEYIVYTYTDKEYTHHREALFYDQEKGRFVVKQAPENEDAGSGIYSGSSSYGGTGSGSNRIDEVKPDLEHVTSEEIWEEPPSISEMTIEAPPKREPIKPVFYFYKLGKNSAKYGEDTLKLNAGETLRFTDVYTKSQKHPLIVSKAGKYGLIFSSSARSGMVYDSLRYIKNQYGPFTVNHSYFYLAGKKDATTGKWLFGIIDSQEKEIIPIQYESLQPNLAEIFIDRDEIKETENFDFRQPYTYSKSGEGLLTLQSKGILTAQLNGKFGLIDFKNQIILPFEYDFIWENGLNFLNTMKIEDEFNVYRKGNMYGVFSLNYKLEKTEDTGAIFPDIPVFRYPNYANKIGFDLYNVAKADKLYFYLVGSNGRVYRK
ncbi:MAG: WG repeat-containing protein [Flavobacteriales bacterium]|nr:WG repeat-containing protein [Flavobacteriales bacterium]